MVHEKIGHHQDGTVIGADADSREWTCEKRRKNVSGEVRASYSPPQRDKEDPLNTIAETDLENLETIIRIKNALKYNCCIFVQRWGDGIIVEEQQQRDVYARLVVYRLRAHTLIKGESADKLDDETLKKELPDFLGTVSMFRIHVDVRSYFECLEKDEDGSVDWYFDREFCKLKDLGGYQRLVLTNHDAVEYLDWEKYRSSFTTYKMDTDYVAFCAKMSEELQWLKSYIEIIGSDEYSDIEIRGANQALMLTTGFPYLNLDLVLTAYKEHIWSLNHDYWDREGWDSIFFAIWKLVTKQELTFTTALTEVIEMPFVGRHKESMLTWSDLETKFVCCVKGIPPEAGDEVAEERIRRAVWELPKKKMLHQYKTRKMEIAESICLHKDVEGPRILDKGTI